MTGHDLERRIRAGLADAAAAVEPTGTLADVRARIMAAQCVDKGETAEITMVLCLVCGKPVPPRTGGGGGSPKVYCSGLCKARAQNRRNAGKPLSGPLRRAKKTRRPLPDFAHDAGWTLRKAVERVERIIADDRFGANREKVTVEIGGHLQYAADTCARMISQIHEEG